MNSTGLIRTVASCQGHIYGKAPYVYFKAPVKIAASIERQLRKVALLDNAVLRTEWIIYALFDTDYTLTFLLHSPELDRGADSILQSIRLFGFQRKRLDAELFTLADIVEQAVMCEVRNNHEPKQTSTSDDNQNCR
jgi:hypothetical protein